MMLYGKNHQAKGAEKTYNMWKSDLNLHKATSLTYSNRPSGMRIKFYQINESDDRILKKYFKK